MTPRRRVPWPLLAMVILVVLPTAVALALYYTGWRPAGSASHGELLRPPPSLAAAGLPGAADEPRWGLLYLPAADCDRACVAALYGLRMAHLAQGKDRPRVRRYVATDSPRLAASLVREDRELRLLSAEQRGRLLEALRETGGQPRIYLVDPRGNAILRYPQDADPNGIRKDLGHLLKHSWVG
jgi:hypothetical protein